MTAIRAIASALPEQAVDNATLASENPEWGMELVAELTGIESRRFAAAGETAFDLSVEACRALLAGGDVALEEIDAILYCTQHPDYLLPGNSHLLHGHLGLPDEVLALDYNLGCSGFVYGLAIADSLARSGAASGILLVTSETQSKRMHPKDRSVRALFGDGAAVTYLAADDGPGGRIVACELATHGREYRLGYIPAGGYRNPPSEETRRETVDRSGNVRTLEHMHMEGTDLWSFVSSVIPGHVTAFLAKHSLTLDDIDVFVFHQASKLILDSLAKRLGIPRERLYVEMREIGNLSSASIPFALRGALDAEAVRPGDRVLLSAFGAGISYGSAIVEY